MNKNVRLKRKTSFTLIELLLGLAVFSIVALSVYSVFSSGLRLSRHSENQSDIYREARLVFGLFANELERMVPYNFGNSYNDKFAFLGKKDEITFLTPSDEGLKVVTYYLVSPEYGKVYETRIGQRYSKNVAMILKEERSRRVRYLLRKERLLLDYLNGDPEGRSQTEIISTKVLEGGLTFSFGYLENQDSQEIVWKEEWKKNYVPSDIKVKIDFLMDEKSGKALSLEKDILVPPGFLGVEKS